MTLPPLATFERCFLSLLVPSCGTPRVHTYVDSSVLVYRFPELICIRAFNLTSRVHRLEMVARRGHGCSAVTLRHVATVVVSFLVVPALLPASIVSQRSGAMGVL